jgi:nitrous oxidase accessory protein NosD
LAIVVVAVRTADNATAQPVRCGETITTDTRLEADLTDCPNNGIVIGADGVTLDLDRHLVDGDGSEFRGCDPRREICDSGVVNDGHDNVTIRDGRVRGFATGILIGTTTATRLRGNRVLGVSALRNQFVGIGVFSAVDSLVRDSSGSDAVARRGGVGLALGDSIGVRVVDSAFRGNSDHGINVFESTHSLLESNRVAATATGIFLLESDHSEVRGNSTSDVGEGILVDNDRQDLIAGNSVLNSGSRGKGGDGIALEDGRANLVVDNLVAHAGGNGIRLGLQQPPRGGSKTVVRDNVVRASGRDGYLVEQKVRQGLLKANVAIRAGDDGFDIESRSTKLTGNQALHNGDLGIEAVRGDDGGRNVARRNGDPRQCANIVCRARAR